MISPLVSANICGLISVPVPVVGSASSETPSEVCVAPGLNGYLPVLFPFMAVSEWVRFGISTEELDSPYVIFTYDKGE